MICAEIESLRNAINDASVSSLLDIAKEICDKAEELDKANDKLQNENDALEARLFDRARLECFDYQALQSKHPCLFTGDLSRLTHADRRELFEEIYNFDGHSDALSSIESRI